MQIVSSEPYLECSFKEFWNEFWSRQASNSETMLGAELVFRGESEVRPKFRIPGADGRGDIFFDNRELFCRFANLPTPSQKRFLQAVQAALAKFNTLRIVIDIPWSKNSQRKLLIRASGLSIEGSFDFDLIL